MNSQINTVNIVNMHEVTNMWGNKVVKGGGTRHFKFRYTYLWAKKYTIYTTDMYKYKANY